MSILQPLKTAIKAIDRKSPYPLFYEFVMFDEEKTLFDSTVKQARNYLEFGLGGSTLRVLQKSRARIYSVESSPQWTDHMRRYFLLRFMENRRLSIFLVDIGPTRDWGYPVSDQHRERFPAYTNGVFEKLNGTEIDVAFIDGRFRVACALRLILHCAENGSSPSILIHDFWNREQYRLLLDYLDVHARVNTLGLFRIKPDVDIGEVRSLYEEYKFIPD